MQSRKNPKKGSPIALRAIAKGYQTPFRANRMRFLWVLKMKASFKILFTICGCYPTIPLSG
jgi:hypothetical protein